MASDHGAATVGGDMDMEAHEGQYHQFIELTKTSAIVVLNIILLLVLWGLEGHGILALIGVVLTLGAAAVGVLVGQGWKMVAPIFVLLAIACVIL